MPVAKRVLDVVQWRRTPHLRGDLYPLSDQHHHRRYGCDCRLGRLLVCAVPPCLAPAYLRVAIFISLLRHPIRIVGEYLIRKFDAELKADIEGGVEWQARMRSLVAVLLVSFAVLLVSFARGFMLYTSSLVLCPYTVCPPQKKLNIRDGIDHAKNRALVRHSWQWNEELNGWRERRLKQKSRFEPVHLLWIISCADEPLYGCFLAHVNALSRK